MRISPLWSGLLIAAGLTCMIGPTDATTERMKSEAGRADAKVVFTSVEWEVNFRRALHAPWAVPNVIAVSPTTPTRLLLRVDQSERPIYLWREREMRKLGKAGESGGGADLPPLPKELSSPRQDMDLWLADPDGSHAQFVQNFKDFWIKALAWSPDGQKLLYQGVPELPDHKPRPSQIYVLDLKSRKSWQISDQGEEMPSWGADSRAVFFWRKLADAIVTPEGNVTAYARWQLLRADAPWEKSQIRPATRTVLSEPSPILPDGNRLLYITLYRDPADGQFRYGPSVIETLATGQTEPLIPDGTPLPEHHPGDTAFPYPSPLWSGNSRWMFHFASLRFGHIGTTVFDLNTHQNADLNPLLSSWADTVLKRAPQESLQVRSAAWLSSDDNRLLLELTTFVFHSDFGSFPLSGPPPKHGWVVYDPIQGKLLPVEGLPRERGPVSHSVLFRVGARYILFPLPSTDGNR